MGVVSPQLLIISPLQKIKLSNNCVIGIGAVVLKDVPLGAVIAGNPTKLIRTQD